MPFSLLSVTYFSKFLEFRFMIEDLIGLYIDSAAACWPRRPRPSILVITVETNDFILFRFANALKFDFKFFKAFFRPIQI